MPSSSPMTSKLAAERDASASGQWVPRGRRSPWSSCRRARPSKTARTRPAPSVRGVGHARPGGALRADDLPRRPHLVHRLAVGVLAVGEEPLERRRGARAVGGPPSCPSRKGLAVISARQMRCTSSSLASCDALRRVSPSASRPLCSRRCWSPRRWASRASTTLSPSLALVDPLGEAATPRWPRPPRPPRSSREAPP